MNFFPSKLVARDGKLYIDAESFQLSVPETKTKTCAYQVCRMETEAVTREIPYKQCRMVPEKCVKSIPCTVLKPVTYEQTVRCVRYVAKTVPYTGQRRAGAARERDDRAVRLLDGEVAPGDRAVGGKDDQADRGDRRDEEPLGNPLRRLAAGCL